MKSFWRSDTTSSALLDKEAAISKPAQVTNVAFLVLGGHREIKEMK